jgi:hypothetical protein
MHMQLKSTALRGSSSTLNHKPAAISQVIDQGLLIKEQSRTHPFSVVPMIFFFLLTTPPSLLPPIFTAASLSPPYHIKT